jgi:hypothetical protein
VEVDAPVQRVGPEGAEDLGGREVPQAKPAEKEAEVVANYLLVAVEGALPERGRSERSTLIGVRLGLCKMLDMNFGEDLY